MKEYLVFDISYKNNNGIELKPKAAIVIRAGKLCDEDLMAAQYVLDAAGKPGLNTNFDIVKGTDPRAQDKLDKALEDGKFVIQLDSLCGKI